MCSVNKLWIQIWNQTNTSIPTYHYKGTELAMGKFGHNDFNKMLIMWSEGQILPETFAGLINIKIKLSTKYLNTHTIKHVNVYIYCTTNSN